MSAKREFLSPRIRALGDDGFYPVDIAAALGARVATVREVLRRKRRAEGAASLAGPLGGAELRLPLDAGTRADLARFAAIHALAPSAFAARIVRAELASLAAKLALAGLRSARGALP